MQTRFNAFAPTSGSTTRFAGPKKKPAALDLSGSNKIQADKQAEDDAFQQQLTDTLKKSGSGRMTGSFVKDVERQVGGRSETQLFINDFKKMLPALQRQANDPSHPDHEYAKNFLREYLRKTPPREEPSASGSEQTLPKTTYKPE